MTCEAWGRSTRGSHLQPYSTHDLTDLTSIRAQSIPLLDHFDQQLNEWFPSNQEHAVQGMRIVPLVMVKCDSDIKVLTQNLITSYSQDLPQQQWSLDLELKM